MKGASMSKAAVVLAAGSGKRMGGDVPKQFLPLLERPVLYWTLAAFEKSAVSAVVLVISDDEAEAFCRKEIVEKYGLSKVKAYVPGGAERYDSVRQGLRFIAEQWKTCEYVAIHDGARCLITPEIIDRTFADAKTYHAAVAAMPVKDTIKTEEDGFTGKTIDRRLLRQMQTPQTFSFALIWDAYERLMESNPLPVVTDDAEVLEKMCGQRTFLSEGSYENLKITTPEDLLLAEAILKHRRP